MPDSCFRSDREPYGRKNFEWTDRNIPPAEVEWLRDDLPDTARKTIVFAHQRLNVSNHCGVKNAANVRKVLEESGKVLAVMQGHSHKNDHRRSAAFSTARWSLWLKEREPRTTGRAQHNLAISRAGQSYANWSTQPIRSLLLAVESVRTWRDGQGHHTAASEQALRDATQRVGGLGLVGHEGSVSSLAISSDSRLLLTGSYDNTARAWDLTAYDPAQNVRILAGHEGPVDVVAISPDDHWLVTGSSDKTARLWDLTVEEEPDKTARVLAGQEAPVYAVATSPDNRWLVTAGGTVEKREAHLRDLTAEELAKSEPAPLLLGYEGSLRAMAISANSRWLATAGGTRKKGEAHLWDLAAEEPDKNVRILAGHQDVVDAVAISPDNRWLVTGSWDKTARLWDLTAENPTQTVRVLAGHEGGVRELAINNRWLVTGATDKTARLWDLTAEEPANTARVLAGHKGRVSAVAISPDNRWLVSGSQDQTARLWVLQVDSLLEHAHRVVGRNFTQREWKDRFPNEPYRKTFPELPAGK